MSGEVRVAEDALAEAAGRAAAAASQYLYRTQQREHWRAELESNVTVTAEYVLLRQALGLDLEGRRAALVRYLCSRQKADGSFGIASTLPGDVSTSAEAYLALRLLGLDREDERLRAAERFIRGAGGLARAAKGARRRHGRSQLRRHGRVLDGEGHPWAKPGRRRGRGPHIRCRPAR